MENKEREEILESMAGNKAIIDAAISRMLRTTDLMEITDLHTRVKDNNRELVIHKTSIGALTLDEMARIEHAVFSDDDISKPAGSKPSKLYMLMIYFAHSTMVMYSADIICNDTYTIKEFRDRNEGVIKRVFDEGLSIMNYELSHEQMMRAISVYMSSKFNPQSVKNSEVHTGG